MISGSYYAHLYPILTSIVHTTRENQMGLDRTWGLIVLFIMRDSAAVRIFAMVVGQFTPQC